MQTYTSHLDTRSKMRATFYLRVVDPAQDLAVVRREGYQDLRSLATHCHKSY